MAKAAKVMDSAVSKKAWDGVRSPGAELPQ